MSRNAGKDGHRESTIERGRKILQANGVCLFGLNKGNMGEGHLSKRPARSGSWRTWCWVEYPFPEGARSVVPFEYVEISEDSRDVDIVDEE